MIEVRLRKITHVNYLMICYMYYNKNIIYLKQTQTLQYYVFCVLGFHLPRHV